MGVGERGGGNITWFQRVKEVTEYDIGERERERERGGRERDGVRER